MLVESEERVGKGGEMGGKDREVVVMKRCSGGQTMVNSIDPHHLLYDNTNTAKGVEDDEVQQPLMHFVLIHGASGGGWCWYKIKCLMESSGYKVTCLDLKGCGTDRSDPNTILSFDEYNQPLLDFLSSLPDDEQVILVGHSAGGLSVTHATHRFAHKISLAIYVAATMLKTGFCTDQDIRDGVPDFSEYGDVYDLGFGLGRDQPPTTVIVKKELQRKFIYQMSPLEDSTLSAILLRPSPIQAFQSARFLGGNVIVEKVPRVYIKTAYDRVLKPEQQDAMIKKWLPSVVYTIESDHSPFFSSPFVLFGFFVKAATLIGL